MVPVLSAAQIRAADAYTIENEPIRSIDLMERASQAFVNKFSELTDQGMPVTIISGIGNNGGDGLAIARILLEAGRDVEIYVVGNFKKGSDDFSTNLKRLEKTHTINLIEESGQIPDWTANRIYIDGLFGSGLSRPVEGLYAAVVKALNASGGIIFSIDVPSGLFADSPTSGDAIIKARYTFSFQSPKLAFFHPQSAPYVGKWHVLDIGLNKPFMDGLGAKDFLTEQGEISLPNREVFDHKGTAGRMLLVAGSKGKMGAATLSAMAAMRSGCGLLFVHTPGCGLDVVQVNVPEAMVIVDAHMEVTTEVLPEEHIDAVVVGPGIGTGQLTQKALSQLVLRWSDPMVLDADAINIVSQNPGLLEALPPETILTPHPGEFTRLVGPWRDDFEKLEKLRDFCKRQQLNVVLKGAFSVVCNTSGEIFFNPTGNPGMATAGSGDVLTGVVGALLAQGLPPFEALRSAVYLHGLAGDLASPHVGEISLIASDIVKFLPSAFLDVKK